MPEKSEVGCGMAFFALMMLVVAYFVGLEALDGMTEGPRQWWHYVVALPIGVICVNLIIGFFRVLNS